MFSRFREDDSLSPPQPPADRDGAPEESAPEISQNPAPAASAPQGRRLEAGRSKQMLKSVRQRAIAQRELPPKPQLHGDDSPETAAAGTDDVGAS